MISDQDWDHLQNQEERLSKLFQARNPAASRRWYDSAGLMAVAAALVTSVGSYWLKTRDDVAKRQDAQLEQMRSAATEANSLMATMLKANEERVLMARGKFDNVPTDQRREISRNTNHLQQQWRQKREDLELGLLLTFADEPRVVSAWSNARRSLDTLTVCVEQAFVRYQHDTAPPSICDRERSTTLDAVQEFRGQLISGYKAVAGQPVLASRGKVHNADLDSPSRPGSGARDTIVSGANPDTTHSVPSR